MYRRKPFSLRSFICFFNLRNERALAGEILKHGKKLYSQHDEELIIRDFFNDRKRGIFVDVGCADHTWTSTTYYLEKHLGWSGVGVDALAEHAVGYIENRPNTRFFTFIVTDHSCGMEPFYRLLNLRYASSTSKEFTENVADVFKSSREYRVICLPTITLTDLLRMNGISKIDFLSMDIEGGETAALSGFDIDKFKPKLVCIEASVNKDKILDYFSKHNYERIEKYLDYDKQNWYFRPKK